MTDKAQERTDQEHLADAKLALKTGLKEEFTETDIAWLKDKMEQMAGTRDLEEGNRRMRVVWGWRRGDAA